MCHRRRRRDLFRDDGRGSIRRGGENEALLRRTPLQVGFRLPAPLDATLLHLSEASRPAWPQMQYQLLEQMAAAGTVPQAQFKNWLAPTLVVFGANRSVRKEAMGESVSKRRQGGYRSLPFDLLANFM